MYYRQQSFTHLFNNTVEEVWPMNPSAEEWFLSHSSSSSSFDQVLSKDRPSPTPSSSSSSSNSANSSTSFDLPTMLMKPKGIRCATCKRRFHSNGNLTNHKQLYQH